MPALAEVSIETRGVEILGWRSRSRKSACVSVKAYAEDAAAGYIYTLAKLGDSDDCSAVSRAFSTHGAVAVRKRARAVQGAGARGSRRAAAGDPGAAQQASAAGECCNWRCNLNHMLPPCDTGVAFALAQR